MGFTQWTKSWTKETLQIQKKKSIITVSVFELREKESEKKLFTSKLNFTVTSTVKIAIIPHTTAIWLCKQRQQNNIPPFQQPRQTVYKKLMLAPFLKLINWFNVLKNATHHIKISPLFNHRIIESFGSEGTLRSHLVQPPCSEQGHH